MRIRQAKKIFDKWYGNGCKYGVARQHSVVKAMDVLKRHVARVRNLEPVCLLLPADIQWERDPEKQPFRLYVTNSIPVIREPRYLLINPTW